MHVYREVRERIQKKDPKGFELLKKGNNYNLISLLIQSKGGKCMTIDNKYMYMFNLLHVILYCICCFMNYEPIFIWKKNEFINSLHDDMIRIDSGGFLRHNTYL